MRDFFTTLQSLIFDIKYFLWLLQINVGFFENVIWVDYLYLSVCEWTKINIIPVWEKSIDS